MFYGCRSDVHTSPDVHAPTIEKKANFDILPKIMLFFILAWCILIKKFDLIFASA